MAALPLTGISVPLVRDTIGAGSNDVGTLCTHPNINPWSKWKPVHFSKITGLAISDLQLVNYGIELDVFTSYENLMTAVDSGVGLSYNKPTGGVNSPYRLGDFRNYNHTAEPAASADMNDLTIDKGSAFLYNKDYYSNFSVALNVSDNYNIGVSDVYPSGANVLGIVLKNGSNTYFVTGSENMKTVVNINWNILPIKNWTGLTQMYVFMTNVISPQGVSYTPSGNDIFVPVTKGLLNVGTKQITLTNDIAPNSLEYFVTSTISQDSQDSYTGSYNITFSSVGSEYAGGNLSECYLNIYEDSSKTQTINSFLLGTFSLSAEDSRNFTGVFDMPTDTSGNPTTGYWEIIVNAVVEKEGAIAIYGS